MPLIQPEPEHVDLPVTQGETFRFQHQARLRGAVTSLAGCTARMGVARRPGGAVLVALSTEGAGLLLEPEGVTGVIDITMTAEQTARLSRDCVYDLLLDGPTGVRRALAGRVLVTRSVSAAVTG